MTVTWGEVGSYTADLAQAQGDTTTAARCLERAARLKRAFHDAFWLPGRSYYAMALDADKRPVDALASNMGHCLWTGIADASVAPLVADHLLSPEMFSGWGVRTLAATADTDSRKRRRRAAVPEGTAARGVVVRVRRWRCCRPRRCRPSRSAARRAAGPSAPRGR